MTAPRSGLGARRPVYRVRAFPTRAHRRCRRGFSDAAPRSCRAWNSIAHPPPTTDRGHPSMEHPSSRPGTCRLRVLVELAPQVKGNGSACDRPHQQCSSCIRQQFLSFGQPTAGVVATRAVAKRGWSARSSGAAGPRATRQSRAAGTDSRSPGAAGRTLHQGGDHEGRPYQGGPIDYESRTGGRLMTDWLGSACNALDGSELDSPKASVDSTSRLTSTCRCRDEG
jgi:hypothetical protein